ncbi:MAG: hypothetical protein K0S38_635 [Candidatus Paceibacter sp.]|jgi:ABC-type dipeptide/oligopeptide/nickel transport system permease component|nr:hypothetical protein [Candidatus Paceibacter sp.]
METAGISYEEHLALSGANYVHLRLSYCVLIIIIILSLIIATFFLIKKRKKIKRSTFILLFISIIVPIIVLVYASFIPYFGFKNIERTFWQEAKKEFDFWWFLHFATEKDKMWQYRIDATR